MSDERARPAITDKSQAPLPVTPPQIPFELLAQGGKEVLIRHGGQLYRLRLTKNGKLILNK